MAAARARPSLLPQDIVIGAPAERAQEAQPVAVLAAMVPERNSAGLVAQLPVPPAVEPVATLEPQPIALRAESEHERNGATLLALAPTPPVVEAAAKPQAQPIATRQASEPDFSLIAGLEVDPAQGRYMRRSAPHAIVVALAPQTASGASGNSNAKEIRVERPAPRFFTDHRGAIFHM